MYRPQSLYRDLDPTKSEMRLLRIVAKNPGSTHVRCRLETVSLDTEPSFCALSYVWGNPNQTANILIANDDASEPDTEEEVPVTTNLEAALRHVGSHWATHRGDRGVEASSLRLWADAICINQADIQERGAQVQMMTSIYKAAELVISWLGPEDFGPAFSGIKTILSELSLDFSSDGECRVILRHPESDPEDFTRLDWIERHPSLIEPDSEGFSLSTGVNLPRTWSSVMDLLISPYWKRVWIFQEIVLAGELLLTTESGSLGWTELLDFGFIMNALKVSLNEPTSEEKPGWLSPSIRVVLTSDILGLRFLTLPSKGRNARWMDPSFQQRRLSSVTSPGDEELSWDRWDMVMGCTYLFQATNPRDYVFGLLGVSGIPIKVDYSESTSLAAIYSTFIKLYLEDARDRPREENFNKNWLGFLGLAGAGLSGTSPEMPTWAPNYQASPTGLRMLEAEPWMADKAVFEQRDDLHPFVEGSRLIVFGIGREKVTFISEAPSEPTIQDGRLIEYMISFIARHPTYVSGIPPLLAFFCLTHQEPVLDFNRLGALRALSFFRYLITVARGPRPGVIEALGLGVGSESPDEWFMRTFFPDAGPEPHGLDFDPLEELLKGPNGGAMSDVWERTIHTMWSIKGDWRIFETETGYLGLGPVGTQVGDEVYVLKNSSVPVIIRREDGEGLSHVGTAFVVGLMGGEAVKFKDAGRSPERLELR